MEDKELKKKLAKIPDQDKNGEPIFKIADVEKPNDKSGSKPGDDQKRRSK